MSYIYQKFKFYWKEDEGGLLKNGNIFFGGKKGGNFGIFKQGPLVG